MSGFEHQAFTDYRVWHSYLPVGFARLLQGQKVYQVKKGNLAMRVSVPQMSNRNKSVSVTQHIKMSGCLYFQVTLNLHTSNLSLSPVPVFSPKNPLNREPFEIFPPVYPLLVQQDQLHITWVSLKPLDSA